jgi:hypothetical protein
MVEEYGSAATRNTHEEEEEQEMPQGMPQGMPAAANGGEMEGEGEQQRQPSPPTLLPLTPPRADGTVNRIGGFNMRGMSNDLPQ